MTGTVALSRITHQSMELKSNCIVFQCFLLIYTGFQLKQNLNYNREEFMRLGEISCEEVYETRQQYLSLSYLEDNMFPVFSNCDATENEYLQFFISSEHYQRLSLEIIFLSFHIIMW